MLDANLRDVHHAMTNRILIDMDAIIPPFVVYDESRGHGVMATLLDPRFCRARSSALPTLAHVRTKETADVQPKWLLETVRLIKVMLHALCALPKSRDDEAKVLAVVDVGLPGNVEPMRKKRVALYDESSCDNDNDADENIVVAEKEYRQSLAETELKVFRQDKATHVLGMVCDVLKWWCVNEHKYPLVAWFARIMLSIPASQIECGRIFSLACLLTQHLRNNMGVENMAATVFITKNLNLSAKVANILKSGLGP
jgi:hypothetical protein